VSLLTKHNEECPASVMVQDLAEIFASELDQGLEQGRAGRKPGCFSHEPGTTRAGPGARFSSTREAPGRAGCMFQQNPARSRVHPPG